jgi:hypothetical protein
MASHRAAFQLRSQWAIWGILAVLVGAPALEGQGPRTRTTPEAVHGLQSRPTTLSPTSGPPGTAVTVRGAFLPAITPVQVALGGTQSGFEALRLVLTNREGELEEVVEIPDWAKRDRAHRFIIFDAYFSPLSASPLFHVTDEDGILVRQGRVEERSATCLILRGDDDERYILQGVDQRLAVGDVVVVEGRFGESSACGDGLVLQVTSLTPAG